MFLRCWSCQSLGGLSGKYEKRTFARSKSSFQWRRHPDLNWGIKVLQTSALPLGYGAIPGGSTRNRTRDTRIFSPLLYRLSYRATLPSNVLLSHTVSRAVPSTLQSLTFLFGMGRSVSSTPSSPDAMILQIFDLAQNLGLLDSSERVSFFKEACSLKIAYK